MLVNGHGGNHDAIDRAVTTLHAEGRDVLAWWPATGLFDAFDAHAGRAETSMMLALRPDLVRVERAAAGEAAPVAALMGRLRAGGVVAVSPNGVLGDPAGATATEGASLLRDLADDLAHAFESWRRARRRAMTTYSLDRSVRRPSAGIVIGGSPLRLFRLTPAGADVFDRITAGRRRADRRRRHAAHPSAARAPRRRRRRPSSSRPVGGAVRTRRRHRDRARPRLRSCRAGGDRALLPWAWRT